MKRIYLVLGLISMTLLSGNSAIFAEDTTTVTIPDTNLASQIREALGLAEGATITEGAMKNLQALYLSQAGGTAAVQDLTGLEKAVNLETLVARKNGLVDTTSLTKPILTPLTGLTNLRWLDLSENSIIDLTPLQDLTNLEVLGLTSNKITTITPLAKLTNLSQIYLGSNFILDENGVVTEQFEDISALAGMKKLTKFYAELTAIHDFSAVLPTSSEGEPKLVEFVASYTKFDAKALQLITNASPTLQLLRLEGCRLSTNDVEGQLVKLVTQASNLKWLQIDANYAIIDLESAAQKELKTFSEKNTFTSSGQKDIWSRARIVVTPDWRYSNLFGYVYDYSPVFAYNPTVETSTNEAYGWIYIYDYAATPSGYFFYLFKDASWYWAPADFEQTDSKYWAYNMTTGEPKTFQ